VYQPRDPVSVFPACGLTRLSTVRTTTDSRFKRYFSLTGTLSPVERTVNRVTIHASPAIFPKMLPFAMADFPQIRAPARAQAELTHRPAQDQSAFEYQAA